ncbi:MAG: hypothetical protein R2941_15995 [Desulfobacterales bacterium]
MMKAETRSQMVKVKTTDGSTFRGKVNLNSENIPIDRLSDLFIKGKSPFLVLYDVSAQGGIDCFIINKAHIVWVAPFDY